VDSVFGLRKREHLITDPAAPPVSITDDVDVIVEIASPLEYARFAKRLRKLGSVEDWSEGVPISCEMFSESSPDFRSAGF